MQTVLLKETIKYDGSQLRPHWIFDETGIVGNACAVFIGACDVSLGHMVDLVDKKAKSKIFSEKMLHFIIEHFDANLERMVLRQRLFVSILADLLRKNGANAVRRGNDIYDGDAKINVSIATASPVSCLMHIGINISSHNTPVKTKGLKDYKINPEEFAKTAMEAYCVELAGVEEARCKVKGVGSRLSLER